MLVRRNIAGDPVRLLLNRQASMTGQKVDFIVEQPEELQESAIELKAGMQVQLINDEATGRSQVYCQGQALGHMPTDQQQQLRGSSCTYAVRSIRKQDGKIVHILVRAVMPSSEVKRLPGMLQLPCSACSMC